MSSAPAADVLPRRNIELIATVKYFIVENLRTARRFLKSCDRAIDIDSLHFVELNTHTDPAAIPAMIAPLKEGHDVGIISEAGCPAIADPGAQVVALAQKHGFKVDPLVGPSSILLALMGSGFNGQSFAFTGYLPIDAAARTAALKRLHREAVNNRQTAIFIETPYRNNRLIAEICTSLPPSTLLCVASDITGPNQQILTLPLSQWRSRQYNYDKIPTIFLLFTN
ncbi:MAG: SAM-dependent methyltransferase [Muribaculaceae bacterium]|nr:SAM-dependent methyltransferase [Muribaculaceae bacterium]